MKPLGISLRAFSLSRGEGFFQTLKNSERIFYIDFDGFLNDQGLVVCALCFHLLPPDALQVFEGFYGFPQRGGEGVADS